MEQYLEMLQHVVDNGIPKEDRTGVGTYSVFGYQFRHDLQDGFPLLTTKRIHTRSVIHELLWFLSGETNVGYLNDHDVTIWDEWADEHGDLGPVYGKQWRTWSDYRGGTIDQIALAIDDLKRDPDSRRHVISAWNVADLDEMALAPCHCLFQFWTDNGKQTESGKRKLSCQLYQRSADIFLGVPFNIASYAMLTHMVAQVCGFEVGDFVHTFGDLHLYSNHVKQARRQLAREPRDLPTLHLNPEIDNIFDFRYEDFEIRDYNPYKGIRAPIAV